MAQLSARVKTVQSITYAAAGGASAPSAAFGSQTRQIRVCALSGAAAAAGDGVRINIGDGTPVAAAGSMLLPLNTVDYFTVGPGQKIAAISNNASTGTLNVVECV